ncbi:hypothetical protein G7046_g8266 [Stylonectria norvegica]|nr:hypothetical protein G7046_g8266 [Stylonectria norvegica]
MDPLSIPASIVGLLAAGAKISNVLWTIIQETRDAPKQADRLFWEVNDINGALGLLQSYVNGRLKGSVERVDLIHIEQLVVTLTTCVKTYSDLQRIIDGLNVHPTMGLLDRLKWTRQQSEINRIMHQLQCQKASLTLILTILQCVTMQEAKESTQHLIQRVEESMAINRDLAERIRGLEREGSVIAQTISEEDTASTIRQEQTTRRVSFINSSRRALQYTFDQDLQASRVYNRAIQRHSMTSLISTALYSTALSVFSKLSLSQISNISFYALPIYSIDISNADCYVFGEEGARQHSRDTPTLPSTTGSDLRERQLKLRSHLVQQLNWPRYLVQASGPTPELLRSSMDDVHPGLLSRFARRQKISPQIRPPITVLQGLGSHGEFDSESTNVLRTDPGDYPSIFAALYPDYPQMPIPNGFEAPRRAPSPPEGRTSPGSNIL